MLSENSVHEVVRIIELLELLRPRNNDAARAKGRNCDLLTAADTVPVSVSLTGVGTYTDTGRRSGGSVFVPEELRVHALVDRGLKRTPESVGFDKNLVEAVAADRLTDTIVRIHHTDIEGLQGGFCWLALLICPDPATLVEFDQALNGSAGHPFGRDSRHLEAAVLEEFDIRFLPDSIREPEAKDERRLIEELFLRLCRGVENVLCTDSLLLTVVFDLDNPLADHPIGNEGTGIVESLAIGDSTQMARDCHCTYAKRRWIHLLSVFRSAL